MYPFIRRNNLPPYVHQFSCVCKMVLFLLLSLLRCVSGYVICPYCDPNYMAFPNLEESMRGYDVPMGNPNPGRGSSDPGIRNQIFVPMYRNEDGHYRLNIRFITANTQIKCDATWSTRIYDNFKDYVNGKMTSSTTGYGIEAGPEINTEINGIGSRRGQSQQKTAGQEKPSGGAAGTAQRMKEEMENTLSGTNLKMGFPHLFSRSWGQEDDVDRVVDFFVKERGTIVVSEAVCLTHKVDIADKSRKFFVEPFLDSVKALARVSNASDRARREEFKRFVNEFGTHYASTTEMGTRLSIESRYTSKERASASVEELKDCNKVSGLTVFGFQTELNTFNCSNAKLKTDETTSNNVDKLIVSTYGSFIADSLPEWSKQVISLVQENAFSPRPIRRELRSILHLFEDDSNFADVTLEDVINDNSNNTKNGSSNINGTAIREWMAPLMQDYCQVFNLDCGRKGCGIDDNCDVQTEFCSPKTDKNDGNSTDEDFECLPRNVTATLPGGGTYVGGVDASLRPDGAGSRFYPAEDEDKRTPVVRRLEYSGGFSHGLRQGEGRKYYWDGQLAYQGHFDKDLMDGRGRLYYQRNGKKLFEGQFKSGQFWKGTLFREDGEVLAEVRDGRVENGTQRLPQLAGPMQEHGDPKMNERFDNFDGNVTGKQTLPAI